MADRERSRTARARKRAKRSSGSSRGARLLWLVPFVLVASASPAATGDQVPLLPPRGVTDSYGFSIALGGGHVAVGEFGRYKTVYVFRRQGGLEAVLGTPQAGVGLFGVDLALEGDLLAVGSTKGVFLYERTQSGWVEGGLILGAARSLALCGDTMAVGDAAGSVKIYRQDPAGAWELEAEIVSPDVGDGFGNAVGLQRGTLVVGAPAGDAPGVSGNKGVGYVYRRVRRGHWEQEAVLAPTDVEDSSQFGRTVGIYDGWAVIGAFRADKLSRGAAFVYRRAGGLLSAPWVLEQKLLPRPYSSVTNAEQFGYSVAIGEEGLFVGAPTAAFRDVLGAGVVYHYEKKPGMLAPWVLEARIGAELPVLEGGFGFSLSTADGGFAVGAPGVAAGPVSPNGSAYHVEID